MKIGNEVIGIIGMIFIWGCILLMLFFAYKRDKKAKKKEIQRNALESINNISFVRIDAARYVMYGEHFRIKNPIAKKKKIFQGKDCTLDGFVIKCEFEQVEDTVMYTDTILGTYIGYNRYNKRKTEFLGVLESVVAGLTFYLTVIYENFTVKWICHILFLILLVVNIILMILLALYSKRNEIMTIVRTTEGDYSVGDIYVSEVVRELLPEKAKGSFSIDQVNRR